MLFEYLGTPVVGLLRPEQGPVGGGTLVEVQGGPFWARPASLGTMFCRFGSDAVSKAHRVSMMAIECVAPSHVAGAVAVEVSMNGLDFTSSGANFVYLSPTIHAVHPTLGPERGGSLIQITGVHMMRDADAFCRFGAHTTSPAKWVSATRMDCVTPPMTSGLSTVALLAKSTGSTLLSTHPFEYQAAAAIFAAVPSSGPAGGGSSGRGS